MERHFDQDIAELKQKLLIMASHAEKAVSEAVNALMNRDLDLAIAIKENDEVLDQFEIEVDEAAIALLSKAPLASDLRLVTMSMKLSQNLERIGDEATKIAKRARDLSKLPPLKLQLDFSQLASLTLNSLKASLDSFSQRDSAAARAMIPRDKEINILHKQIQAQIVEHMKQSPENIDRCLHLLVAAKSFERIGDHATNIAEEVVYLCEAKDIRHAG